MSTPKKFYISDLHIGHKNILNLDNRPFFNLADMKETIIDNWNKVVSTNDSVYVLGDMFWNKSEITEVMPKLKGNKFLIKGNHDIVNNELKKYFIWIKDYEVIKDGKEHVVLCHYPIAHWINADYDYIHLYGHIHNGRDTRPFEEYTKQMKNRGFPYKCANVGCMLHDYTPVTLDDLGLR
jgi:calcineurin-like phosphoesterase family protein